MPKPAMFADTSTNWAGEFRDPDLEETYRDHNADAIREALRASAAVFTFGFVLIVLRDYLRHGGEPPIHALIGLKLVTLLLAAAFLTAVEREASGRKLSRLGGIFMIGMSAVIAAQWLIEGPSGIVSASVALIAAVVYWVFIPAPVAWKFGNAIGISLGYLAVTGYFILHPDSHADRLPPLDEYYTLVVILIGGNLLGVVGLRRLAEARREAFLSARVIERAAAERDAARFESRQRDAYQAWALDALPIGVVLVDPERRLHTINRRAIEVLDISPEMLVPGLRLEEGLATLARRRDFGDISFDDMIASLERMVTGELMVASARSLRSGVIIDFTLRRLPDGSLAVALVDSTERHALTRRLHHAMDAAGDGFAIYDSRDRVVVCSNKFAELYRLTPDEMVGMSFHEVLALGNELRVFGEPGRRISSSR